MKALYDLLPLLLFFAAYWLFDIYVATGAAILAAGIQLAWELVAKKQLNKTYLVNFLLIGGLGGLTIALHDPVFLKWKPTAVNWLFAGVFVGSLIIGRRPILQRLMSSQVTLADASWRKLTMAWGFYFLFCGALNLYVAFGYKVTENDLDAAQLAMLASIVSNDKTFVTEVLKQSPDDLTVEQLTQLVPRNKTIRAQQYLDALHLDLWVKFKVFGLFALTLAFVVAQSIYIARLVDEPIGEAP